ncbi:MAG: hypothetical protein MZV64_35945 [Ignavibacteriales bacterium]|nr:hypothetical protein [Ignavibacteriales bacterium]
MKYPKEVKQSGFAWSRNNSLRSLYTLHIKYTYVLMRNPANQIILFVLQRIWKVGILFSCRDKHYKAANRESWIAWIIFRIDGAPYHVPLHPFEDDF